MRISTKRQKKVLNRANTSIIELLESRLLLSAIPNPPVPAPPLPQGNEPLQGVVGSPFSFSPQMVDQLYGFRSIYYNVGGNVQQADGSGITIAIVDAYGSPTIVNDAKTFDAHWGLSDADSSGNFFLTVQALAPTANSLTEPPTDIQGWSGETSLDVEWAHVVAPKAHIILVEAPSDGLQDLAEAINFAITIPSVSVISCSFGSTTADERIDGLIQPPTGHQNVSVFVSSGDIVGELQYPAESLNVVPVGGMGYDTDIYGNIVTFHDWTGPVGGPGSSGGVDALYPAPIGTYNEPMVSMDADPATGVWVYDSSAITGDASFAGSPGWLYEIGGTSLATPMWAAYFSTIQQGMLLKGAPMMSTEASQWGGTTSTIEALQLAGEGSGQYFFNVNTPAFPAFPSIPPMNGGNAPIPTEQQLYSAIPGNAGTGFGSPKVSALTDYFMSLTTSETYLEDNNFKHDANAGLPSTYPVSAEVFFYNQIPHAEFDGLTATGFAGTVLPAFTVSIRNSDGSIDAAFNGQVNLSVAQGALSGTTSVTAVNGVATFTNVAIDQTNTGAIMTATALDMIPGDSPSVAVNPSAPTQLVFTSGPSGTIQYATLAPVIVKVEDSSGNPVVSDGSVVAIAVNSGPGAIGGTVSVRVIHGDAVFSDIHLDMPGTYTLIAHNTGDGIPDSISASFSISAAPIQRIATFNGSRFSRQQIVAQQTRNANVLAGGNTVLGVGTVFIAQAPSSAPAVASPAAVFSQTPISGSASNDLFGSVANLRNDDATSLLAGN